jgi:DNA-binding LacI/PurR family transcriptional regulator
MKRASTQSDIARLTGLDKSSVSLALRSDPRIPEETRCRVLETARKCNYRPNLAARQLNGSRTQVLGLVLSTFASLHESLIMRTLQVLAQLTSERGMLLTVLPDTAQQPGAMSQENAYPMLVDGLLVWGEVPRQHVDQLAHDGLPAVVLDPCNPSYATWQYPAVCIDNISGARQIVQHLIERNAQRLLFVKTVQDHLGHDQRWNAARAEWLQHRSFESLSFCLLEELTEAALREFVAKPSGAIFCSNDTGALSVWRRLMAMGVKVPEQVKIAGFDGLQAAKEIHLTTAVFDCEGVARAGLDTILALLKKESVPEKLVVSCALDKGETT